MEETRKDQIQTHPSRKDRKLGNSDFYMDALPKYIIIRLFIQLFLCVFSLTSSNISESLLAMHPSDVLDMPVDPNEPTYCLCSQVSYGEMIGCDNSDVSNRFVYLYIYVHTQINVFTIISTLPPVKWQ